MSEIAISATEVESPARVLVGSDDQSHIVDVFDAPWCGATAPNGLDLELYDEAADVDCPECISVFHGGED